MNYINLVETIKRSSRGALMLTACCLALNFTFTVNAHEPSSDEGSNGTAHTEEVDSGTVHIVEIKEFKFVPVDIEVEVGDTIKWVNLDFVPHTATADDQRWDSELLVSKAEWEMVVTKDSAGNYICTYHPTMTGSISLIE